MMGTQMYVLESKDDQQWQGCKWIAQQEFFNYLHLAARNICKVS